MVETKGHSFTAEEFRHTAECLRSENDAIVKAVASNNLNIILAALDQAAAAPDMLDALEDLHAFVAVMIGAGSDAVIPETVRTPLGALVKVGAIMRAASDAIAKARNTNSTS